MSVGTSGRSTEILLIEDNPGDVRLVIEALKEGRGGSSLSVVKDGVEALAFLRREGPFVGAARPDLILLDLNLPRKDGREVLAEIKRSPHLRSIPVVVLTTSAAKQDVSMSYNLHANCFITKPAHLEQYIKIVRAIEDFWLNIVRLPTD